MLLDPRLNLQIQRTKQTSIVDVVLFHSAPRRGQIVKTVCPQLLSFMLQLTLPQQTVNDVIHLVAAEPKRPAANLVEIDILIRRRRSEVHLDQLSIDVGYVESLTVEMNDHIGLVQKIPQRFDHLLEMVVMYRLIDDFLLMLPPCSEAKYLCGSDELIQCNVLFEQAPGEADVGTGFYVQLQHLHSLEGYYYVEVDLLHTLLLEVGEEALNIGFGFLVAGLNRLPLGKQG